ncbi:hypothetical protein C0992_008391, partial [Termitomyces sp. T32_za158]
DVDLADPEVLVVLVDDLEAYDRLDDPFLPGHWYDDPVHGQSRPVPGAHHTSPGHLVQPLHFPPVSPPAALPSRAHTSPAPTTLTPGDHRINPV